MPENRQLVYNYNEEENEEYKRKRKKNMRGFTEMIKAAKNQNSQLSFKSEMNRLVLYKTRHNEKVCIQYPGKESARPKKTKPFDFKPLILKEDGTEINDMDFSDVFEILEQIGDDSLLQSLALILFRISRLSLHCDSDNDNFKKTNTFQINTIDESSSTIHVFEISSETDNSSIPLNWTKLYLGNENIQVDDATQDALQCLMDIPNIHLVNNNGTQIENQSFSIEAFLYFIDLLLLNEDIKYNYDFAKDRIHLPKRGRKGTIDFLLGYIFVRLKKKRLSDYIQRLALCRGVIQLADDEYRQISGLEL